MEGDRCGEELCGGVGGREGGREEEGRKVRVAEEEEVGK